MQTFLFSITQLQLKYDDTFIYCNDKLFLRESNLLNHDCFITLHVIILLTNESF
jgi:hypothetical protein